MRLGANPYRSASDDYFMYEALRLARRGLGWTSPNPPVGCVIVRDGEIIGRGWHEAPGDLHAETAALMKCEDARGSTIFVTLEPCSHIGTQPACTTELIRAGVAHVFFGCDDADPRSAGKATSILKSAGIAVTSGVLKEECQQFLLPYLHAKSNSSPHTHLKLALSLDGKLALANGASQWISGPQSHGLAHYLRQQYDAVMVGRGTVAADNPQLTVREEVLREYTDCSGMKLRDPVRIVVVSELNSLKPLYNAHLFRSGNQRTDLPGLIVICAKDCEQTTNTVWAPGTEVIAVRRNSTGSLDLRAAVEQLPRFGVWSALVEGGAHLASELLNQNAADYMTLVYAPLLLGDDARGFTSKLGLSALTQAQRFTLQRVERLGHDTVIELNSRN